MRHTNHKNAGHKRLGLALGAGALTVASALLLPVPATAYDASFSGESSSIVRLRTTADQKEAAPAYEYLRLNLANKLGDGSRLSFDLGTWGRADLAEKSASKSTDGDIQYAFLTYYGAKYNTVASVGRQFISEGIAAERIDGLYLRNNFGYGIGTAAFVGKSVITDPSFNGGELMYGARIHQTDRKYYTVGLSALKSDYGNGISYREEEGVDVWLRPHRLLDLTGRSAYNSLTGGWMEHAYSATCAPAPSIRLGAEFSQIHFKDYLASVTTAALSLTNPIWKTNDKQTAIGGSVAYNGLRNLSMAADYKQYSYSQSGDASYFGGKVSWTLSKSLAVGGGIHRMEGAVDRLRYVEFRAFASTKAGPASLVLDSVNVNYDKRINGIRSSHTITGAAGYEVNRKLKLGADVAYSRNPDFDNEVRSLIKLIYTFDAKFAEGRKASEK